VHPVGFIVRILRIVQSETKQVSPYKNCLSSQFREDTLQIP